MDMDDLSDLLYEGCDLRNIDQVILWGIPPTFCALVQGIGRAARDLTKLGEGILLVPKGIRRTGTSSTDVCSLQTQIADEEDISSTEDEGESDNQMEMENVVEASGHKQRGHTHVFRHTCVK